MILICAKLKDKWRSLKFIEGNVDIDIWGTFLLCQARAPFKEEVKQTKLLISRPKKNKFHFPIQKSISFSPIILLLINMHHSLYLWLSLIFSVLKAHTGKRTCSQSWLCNRTEHLIVTSLMNPLTDSASSYFPTLFKRHLNLTSLLFPCPFKLIFSSPHNTHTFSLSLSLHLSRYIHFHILFIISQFRVDSPYCFYTHWKLILCLLPFCCV